MSETVAAPTHDDEHRIRDVVAEASRAQNDIDALLTLHTPDAVVVNFPGRRVLGRAALAEAMAGALNSPLSEVLTTVEVVDVRFPTRTSPWSAASRPCTTGGPTRRMHYRRVRAH